MKKSESQGCFLPKNAPKMLLKVKLLAVFILMGFTVIASGSISQGTSQQPGTTITGTVTDNTGEPVIGAAVVVPNTTIGTATNADGQFTLNVPQDAEVLEISYIGMERARVEINGRTQIDVTLTQTAIDLEEVIAVGYGTQTKRAVTGSIQSVSSEELENIPVTSTTQTLQGKMAGVQINQITGRPGEDLLVRVRGAGSISAGSEPLYVVDGFPIDGGLTDFSAEEIETITVLKDAASTSLYGSRAANGVVLITTKRATQGATQIGFNAYYGVQNLPAGGRPEMMNGQEWAQFRKETFEDLGEPVPVIFQNPAQYGEGYDWYDIMFDPAPMQEYNITLSSATERFSASAVAGYLKQDGIMINSGYERFNLRVNTEFNANDWLTLGFNVAPTYNKRFSAGSDGPFFGGNLLYLSLLNWPIIGPDGNIGNTGYTIDDKAALGGFPQPNYYESAQLIKNDNNSTRLLTNGYISIEPIDGLVLKQQVNVQLRYSNDKFWNPSNASQGFNSRPPVTARVDYGSSKNINWLSETTATYTKSFDSHNIELLAGYSAQEATNESMDMRGEIFPDDRINDYDAAESFPLNGNNTGFSEWALISYLGRLNYDYMGRYLVSASVRRDGSSRFGKDNLWGTFPSASLGWILSDEPFYPQDATLNFVKLRASYGTTGNNDIGNYTQYASVSLGQNYPFGGSVASGAATTNLANPTLSWEKSDQLNLGVDLAFLDNRISLNYDYYNKKTYDMLYEFDIPQSSGFSDFQGNSGELKFWGHEIAVTSRNFVSDFKWTTQLNFTFSDNEVISLAPNVDAIYGGGHVTRVGDRVGLFWGLVFDGIFDDQAELDAGPVDSRADVGTTKFVDQNDDGRIDNRDIDGDRTVIGDPTPTVLIGATNTFEYKNFDLSIVMSGSLGADIANRFYQGVTNLDGPFNVLKKIQYRWRSPENPGTLPIPKAIGNATNRYRDWFHSGFIENGDYLTIKNVTLGYDFDVSSIDYFSRLRLYASVQQLYTFTNYSGNNPEVSDTATNILSLGDDNAGYPIPRTWTFGINVNF